MNSYTGRRKYKRIELEKWKYKEIVSPCITRFRVTPCDDQETSSLEWSIVAVKNLSAGGIMFNYYKMDLGFGSLLELKLNFIKSKPTISCIGRVVRIEDAHTNSMFRIAAEFTEINDLDREIINTTVEAILKREAKKKIYPEKLLKMTNTLTRRLGIAEARLEGSKTKTMPSVDMDDEFWTRIHTAPEILPLEESEMILGSVPSTLRNGDIDGQGKQIERPLEPNDVEGISVKNRIQEAKKAEHEAELKAEREAKKAECEAELKTEREAKKAECEAELKAEREAKKAKFEAELKAEREAKKAEHEAELKVEREAKKAKFEAELKVEREVKKAECETELKAEREAKKAEHEAELIAEREAKKAEFESELKAEREAKKVECEAELKAEREAKKAECEAELKAEREAKKAEHEAELKTEREAKKAKFEAELKVEREVKKAECETELKAEREAKKAEREAELKAEREAKKAELKAEREAKKTECEAKLKVEREARMSKRKAKREAKKAVLDNEVYGYHGKSRETTQKKSHTTAFVIAYMVLMLILGFVVHRDLTKRIDRLVTKTEIVSSKIEDSAL